MEDSTSAEETGPWEFQQISNLFVELGCFHPPSEFHGLLCGQLCGGARHNPEQWLDLVCELLGLEQRPGGKKKDTLVECYYSCLTEISDPDFAFDLLMPDEQVSIAERTEALGHWCQGFLAGFGLVPGVNETDLSENVSAALKDFSAISQVDINSDDDDSGESDLMEVSEYVRVAVLLVFAEIGVGPLGEADESTNPVVH